MRADFKIRPAGITALSIFFLLGAVISLTSAVSLLFPQSFPEAMWRLNPRARTAFAGIGAWAVVLMFAVSISCGTAAIGLWRGSRWGYRVAVSLIAFNLIGDLANALLGTEPRAIVGVPFAVGILAYLMSKRVRYFSRNSSASAT